jgi:hypothetical protein
VRLFIDETLPLDFALRLNATGDFDTIHPLHVGRRASPTTAFWPGATKKAVLSLRKMRATFESWSAARLIILA